MVEGGVVDVGALGDVDDVLGFDDGIVFLKVSELAYETFKSQETVLCIVEFGLQKLGLLVDDLLQVF